MDVVDIAPDQVRPTPDTGCSVGGELIEGIATVDAQMLILLDAAKVIFHEPAAAPTQAAA